MCVFTYSRTCLLCSRDLDHIPGDFDIRSASRYSEDVPLYLHTKNEVSVGLNFQKLKYEQERHRQTRQNTLPAAFVGDNKWIREWRLCDRKTMTLTF